ncbi:MAG: sigma-70 family RNA polymerase sigma factor [Polyangiales bacterium]
MRSRVDETRYARVWREAMAMATRSGVRDRAAREDLAQEVTVRAWRSGRDERPWLLTVMRHCAADHHRAAARCVALADLDAPARDASAESRLEARRALEAVLARAEALSPSLRAVFDAVVCEGRDIGDVARALGVSRAVIDTRLLRMKRRLRAEGGR